MTLPRSPSRTIFIDAAAPLLEPRWLGRHLPSVVAGGVDVLLTTAGAIEDFRTTMRESPVA